MLVLHIINFVFLLMQKKFSICAPDHKWARNNFEMRDAIIMKNNLNKARQRKIKLNWIVPSNDLISFMCILILKLVLDTREYLKIFQMN